MSEAYCFVAGCKFNQIEMTVNIEFQCLQSHMEVHAVTIHNEHTLQPSKLWVIVLRSNSQHTGILIENAIFLSPLCPIYICNKETKSLCHVQSIVYVKLLTCSSCQQWLTPVAYPLQQPYHLHKSIHVHIFVNGMHLYNTRQVQCRCVLKHKSNLYCVL